MPAGENNTMEKMTEELAGKMLDEQGYHCSQVVISHASEQFGLEKEEAMKLASGLGGGCFAGETCGAVSGAIILLGLKYGFSAPNSKEQDQILKNKIHEFEKKFVDRCGSLTCRGLLDGLSNADPEQSKLIEERGLYSRCKTYCAASCEILDEMLK